jgi:BirA family biotin operon repressor/biotin-[acetyl-CoA-carboxylase] ligase
MSSDQDGDAARPFGGAAAAILAARDRLGIFAGRVEFHDEVGSTNDVADERARRGAPEGIVIVADVQRSGRGRRGRSWHSPRGVGLYFSTALRPVAAEATAAMLTLAAGSAVAMGIRRAAGLPVDIKWPNDVVAPGRARARDRRKIAGILAEARSAGGGVAHVIVGCGVNVGASTPPADIAAVAASIEGELGRPVDRVQVLVECLAALDAEYCALQAGRAAEVLERWRALAPSAMGAGVMWNDLGRSRAGVTTGVTDRGALLVRTDDGAVHQLVSADLVWL